MTGVTFTNESPQPPRHPLLDVELDRMLDALSKCRGRAETDAMKANVRAWLRRKWDREIERIVSV